jgi:AraC-like DNA-binding protein
MSIAFESGFGDLSTFNNRFRGIFGVNPTAYRATVASAAGARRSRRH